MASATSTLPPLITSPSDLKRTRRELEVLDDFLHQASLRQGGKAVKLPAMSRLLEEIANDSGLNLLKKADRDRLAKFLTLLLQKAPVLHITLASEPSATALGKLLTWLRASIHPQVLVSIGVQPAIAAGCIVRTANREFDFSLRQSLDAQTEVLMKSIRAGDVQAARAAVEDAESLAPAPTPEATTAQPAAQEPAKAAIKVEVKS
jgi:F0F1-type ATP synthase delta subunit